MKPNETFKALWEINGAIAERIIKLNKEINEKYHAFDMDAVRILEAKKDAYEDCSTEIMKIIPKYMEFDKEE